MHGQFFHCVMIHVSESRKALFEVNKGWNERQERERDRGNKKKYLIQKTIENHKRMFIRAIYLFIRKLSVRRWSLQRH